jgi:hypothetical protein
MILGIRPMLLSEVFLLNIAPSGQRYSDSDLTAPPQCRRVLERVLDALGTTLNDDHGEGEAISDGEFLDSGSEEFSSNGQRPSVELGLRNTLGTSRAKTKTGHESIP